jgi:SsrA-binding protein
MAKPKKKPGEDRLIAQNKRARHDYFIEQDFEAGLCLEGWEVKSLREKRVSISESYAIIQNGEGWLVGATITPLKTASTHINPEPGRSRKMLLNRRELDVLIGNIERKGYTLVPVDLHWTRGKAKLKVGLAKGKKQHDKRAADKDRDWARQKARVLKKG